MASTSNEMRRAMDMEVVQQAERLLRQASEMESSINKCILKPRYLPSDFLFDPMDSYVHAFLRSQLFEPSEASLSGWTICVFFEDDSLKPPHTATDTQQQQQQDYWSGSVVSNDEGCEEIVATCCVLLRIPPGVGLRPEDMSTWHKVSVKVDPDFTPLEQQRLALHRLFDADFNPETLGPLREILGIARPSSSAAEDPDQSS